MMDGEPFYPHWCRETMGASSEIHQFSLWPLRSAPGSLGTYGFLTPSYGLPYGLELKNNPRLCTSLRVYASNTPQEAAILILGAARRQSENCRAPKAKLRIAEETTGLTAWRFPLGASRFAPPALRFPLCASRFALPALRLPLCASRFAPPALRLPLCACRLALTSQSR